MKNLRIAAAFAALALSSGAQSGGEAKALAPVTLRGEVVDLHCYITRAAKGPDHAGCGNACLSRGVAQGMS